jgi:hypothetical protein
MANKQTMATNNCGQTYRLIPAGQAVPVTTGNPCAWNTALPNYPMPGDTAFRTTFSNNVIANVKFAYDYTIYDAQKFIGSARYLGKPNADADSDDKNTTAYEMAENVVIDKRLRDVTNDILVQQDIVGFDQAQIETQVLEKINAALSDKGIKIGTLAFTITPEQHTREAIDIATAMRVYAAAGLLDEGKRIVEARAGAPIISTTVSPQVVTRED